MELFFNEPTKQLHFEEISKICSITRKPLVRWLKKFQKDNLINRIKPRGQMPYYVAKWANPEYKSKKRLFALEMLRKSGFIAHLMQLHKAKTVILFGSMARWDWYSKSDVDVFIYGAIDGLEVGKYELKLKRDIQIFAWQDKNSKEIPAGLMKTIIQGDIIKGILDFVEVRSVV